MYDNNYPRSDYSGGSYSGGNHLDENGNDNQTNDNGTNSTYRYTGNPYPENSCSSFPDSPGNPYGGNYYNHIPQEPKKNKDKKGGVLKKLVILAGMGIFFGLCAGITFYSVGYFTGNSDKVALLPETPQLEEEVGGALGSELKENSNILTTNNTQEAIVTDVTDVATNVMPSVVSITNVFTEKSNFFGQVYENQASASGSGIIVGKNDTELLLVSNYHVVENADTLMVQFIDNEQVEAQMKGSDSTMDLAVFAIPLDTIKESTLASISIATLGDSDALKVGEPAIAIGNALGYGQSVTTGVISAVDRTIEVMEGVSGTFIQTDAAINPGNSGGALLNVEGKVIGINSNKIGGTAIEGMGYAIPISVAKPIIEDLMTKETKSKVEEGKQGFLGIAGQNVTSDVSQMYNMPEGIYVSQVYEGTGAEAAGMVKGDIITKFDSTTVKSMEELQKLLGYYEVGATVDVTVMQGSPSGYQEKTVIITLGEKTEISAEQQQQQPQMP